jgi:dihydropyrimidine dehydrogenase (NAD+) subunit PreA
VFEIQGAGAQLIEMNLSSSTKIEKFTSLVKQSVHVPVTVKLTHNIADSLEAALAAQAGGADAISAMCTLKSRMTFDPPCEGIPDVSRAVHGFPGRAKSMSLSLEFLDKAKYDRRITIPTSGMGGIYTWKDAVEYLSYGATNLQVSSALAAYGPRIIEDLTDGLERYMVEWDVTTVKYLIDAHESTTHKLGHEHILDILGRGDQMK